MKPEEEKSGTDKVKDAVRKLRQNFLEEGKAIPYGSLGLPTQEDIESGLKAVKDAYDRALSKAEGEEEDKE